jgi:ASPM-SPD-2-Hydin domain-containing protein
VRTGLRRPISPASHNFGNVAIGTTSAALSVKLWNNLLSALPIGSVTFTGANPGDFGQTNNCGGSVAAKSSCTISVTFTPSAAGTRTATLNVNDSANNSPQTATLTGTGK